MRRIQTKFINYETYIKSPEWREVRERYFKSNQPQKCFACDKPKAAGFHIHHKTYKRLGMEYLSDLVLMCPDCHTKTHNLQKKTGMALWGATNAYIRKKRKQLGLHPKAYKTR